METEAESSKYCPCSFVMPIISTIDSGGETGTKIVYLPGRSKLSLTKGVALCSPRVILTVYFRGDDASELRRRASQISKVKGRRLLPLTLVNFKILFSSSRKGQNPNSEKINTK